MLNRALQSRIMRAATVPGLPLALIQAGIHRLFRLCEPPRVTVAQRSFADPFDLFYAFRTRFLTDRPTTAHWLPPAVGTCPRQRNSVGHHGGRDIAALGFAIAGLIAVGPGELFFPKSAAGLFGPWVWLALIAFYALTVSLFALTSRPRLVVYGRTPDQMIDPLFEAAQEIDPDAICENDKREVYLPKHRLHLRVAGYSGIDSAYIESFQPVSNLDFWNRLLGHVRDKASQTPAPTPRRGAGMIVAALALATLVLWQGFHHHQQLVQGFRDWLWR